MNGLNLDIQRNKLFSSNALGNWIFRFLRIGFGILLILASIDKISHPFEFAKMVENYQIIGSGLSYWIAVWFPYLECLLGLLLLINIWMDAATLMNAFFMFLFLVLVFQAYLRGLDIECGCFSVTDSGPINLMKLMENGLFTGFSLFLLWSYVNRKRILSNIQNTDKGK